MKTLERTNKQRFQHEAINAKISGIEKIYSDSNIDINASQNLQGLLREIKGQVLNLE
jgi:hypothetical protein